MPNRWTFKQPKLLSFITKYIPHNSRVLIPFAGEFRFGNLDGSTYIYNDINKEIKADHNIDAYLLKDYYEKGFFDVIIADPPYTDYQAVILYNNKNLQRITLWRKTANYLLKPNGIYIELGYNSNGIKGYEDIALGDCKLGGSHNDILILVQKKPNTLEGFL